MEIKEETEFDGFVGDVYCIDQFRNVIVTGGHDKKVYLWNADINNEETFGQLKCELIGHEHSIKSLTHAENDNDIIIISGSWDSTIRLWSYQNLELINVLQGHSNRIRQVGICHVRGAITILSTGDDRSLRLWDMVTGIPLRIYENHHKDTIHCFCLYQKHNNNSLNSSKIDTFIATGSADKLIKCFYLNEQENDSAKLLQTDDEESQKEGYSNRIETLSGHEGRIMCLLSWTNPITQTVMLASSATDETVKIWNMENGHNLFTIQNLCPISSLGVLSYPPSSTTTVGVGSSFPSSSSSSFVPSVSVSNSGYKAGLSVAEAAAAAPAVLSSSSSSLPLKVDMNYDPNEVVIPSLWTADSQGHVRIFDTCTGEPLSLSAPTTTTTSRSSNRRGKERQPLYGNSNSSVGGVVTGAAMSLVSVEQALHGLDVKWMNNVNNSSSDITPLRLVLCGSQSVTLYSVLTPLSLLKRKINNNTKIDKKRVNLSRSGKRSQNNRNFNSISDRDFNRLPSRNRSRHQSRRGKREDFNNNNNNNNDDWDTQSLGANFKSPQRFLGALDSGADVDFTLPGIRSPTDHTRTSSRSSKRAIYDATPDDDDFSVMSLEVGTRAYDPNSLLQPFEGNANQRRTRFGGKMEANLNRRRELNKQKSVLIDARNNNHFLNMQPNLPVASQFKQQMAYINPNQHNSNNSYVGGNSINRNKTIGYNHRNSNRSVNYNNSNNNGMSNSSSHGNTAIRSSRLIGGVGGMGYGNRNGISSRQHQRGQQRQYQPSNPNPNRMLSISQWNKKLAQ